MSAITETGIYQLSMDYYQADPCPVASLSSGIAKLLVTRSPLHAWMAHPRLNPEYEKRERATFDLGSAAHSCLFEDCNSLVVLDAADWRTKSSQEFRDNARAEGKIPILQKQFDMIHAMGIVARKVLRESADLQIDLTSGRAEESFIWREDDIWLRARLDWNDPALGVILDYKTLVGSANPNNMARYAYSMGWDVQSSFYCRGFSRLHPNAKLPKFIFIAQETDPPYAVSFVGMEGTFRALGDDKVEQAIRLWRQCMKAGKWPGYTDRVVYPDPPAWATLEWEENQECKPL